MLSGSLLSVRAQQAHGGRGQGSHRLLHPNRSGTSRRWLRRVTPQGNPARIRRATEVIARSLALATSALFTGL